MPNLHFDPKWTSPVIDALAEQPLLLLAVVLAVGQILGRIRVAGAKLGAAAVLFVGLAVGGLDERLRVPDIVFLIGLSTLVYTIGLTSAATIQQILTKEGIKRLGVGLFGLTAAGVSTYFASRTLGITGAEAAGAYAGAFTNASGLASAVDYVNEAGGRAVVPVVTYSVAYPVGVFGPLFVMLLARWLFRTDLAKEALTIPSFRKSQQKLSVATVRIANPAVVGKSIAAVARELGPGLLFGRHRRGSSDHLASGQTVLEAEDMLTVIGSADDIASAETRLGIRAQDNVELDRSEFDVRRVFVSRPEIVGIELRHLDVPANQEALITRVRRGDLDFIPNGSTRLELGDRVRILAKRDRLEAVAQYFGDSYRALAEVDLLTFCLGLLLGLLLGAVPIPLPGGSHLRLGFAGGPLVMSLILGRLRRTGPLVWSLPYSANLTLRQFGLALFSAGIGTRAGFAFFSMVESGDGLQLLALGAALTLGSGILTMLVGFLVFRIPLNILLGVYAGAQTQPVSLGFATEQTKNDLPAQAYAAMFPIATLYKIVVGQALLILLGISD